MSASSDINLFNDSDKNNESNVDQFDDLECLFQEILINKDKIKDYNEVCQLQKPKGISLLVNYQFTAFSNLIVVTEHILLEDNYQLPYLLKNNTCNELLVISTPTKEGKRKLQRQNRQDEPFNADNESFTINDMDSNYNIFKNDSNETKHAEQYLQMYSTPMHRWSIDMIPNNNFRYHTLINVDHQLKRQKLSQQSKSFEDEYLSMIELKSKSDFDFESDIPKLNVNDEKEETNSIFYGKIVNFNFY